MNSEYFFKNNLGVIKIFKIHLRAWNSIDFCKGTLKFTTKKKLN